MSNDPERDRLVHEKDFWETMLCEATDMAMRYAQMLTESKIKIKAYDAKAKEAGK
jgi:hypothetical protein